ncbi:IS66 family insertion sequence element accessory protein TnpB [Vibrio parahaemolyticus]|nr:IS66 family insertion sequence element accessory protein TnpB [Vibrio parahaemolyticus]
MIRIDHIWLSTEPLDMRAGPDTCLARVVKVFGQAEPHQAYVFLNKRGNRMKVLVHDGFGLWLAARRLHQGRFIPAQVWQKHPLVLSAAQLNALTVGLPWYQVGKDNAISVL